MLKIIIANIFIRNNDENVRITKPDQTNFMDNPLNCNISKIYIRYVGSNVDDISIVNIITFTVKTIKICFHEKLKEN